MIREFYRNAVLRFDSSVTQPSNFADKLLPHEKQDSRMNTSLQMSVWDLQNSVGLSAMHMLARQVSLYSATRVRRVLMPYFSNFQRMLLVVHLEQAGLQKRFLMYQISSVFLAAGKNRGESILRDSGIPTG